jgi:TPR repeat protein
MQRSIAVSSLSFWLALGFTACAGPVTPPPHGLHEVRLLADKGDVIAQRKLGMAYDSGQGVPRDLGEAAKWYAKAAEQGDGIAQNNLGSLFQNGEGVPKDLEKAVYWYRKASDQKNAQAQNNLAYMYDLGLGVPQDNVEAVRLYELSAVQGWTEAMLNLGILYGEEGQVGLTKNNIEAYKWLDLARLYTQNAPPANKVKWRARGALDELKAKMSKDEIATAQNSARSWDASHRR